MFLPLCCGGCCRRCCFIVAVRLCTELKLTTESLSREFSALTADKTQIQSSIESVDSLLFSPSQWLMSEQQWWAFGKSQSWLGFESWFEHIWGFDLNYKHLVKRSRFDFRFDLKYYDTIRYDTRCYINMRSKVNMSQLNLPHGNRQLKSVKTEKLKVENRYAKK